MALSNLEKQQKRLEKLNEKIRLEKEKIERNLGREIIKNSNIDYSEFTKEKIAEIGKLLGSKILDDLESQQQKSSDLNESGSIDFNNQLN